MANRFWLKLWFYWAVRLTVQSIVLATFFSFIVTLYIYFLKSTVTLNRDVLIALFDIFKFWFVLFWSVALLISMFGGVKHFFNHCIEGYELKLLTCKGDDVIETIGYGDISKVFRKWMMSMIWSVTALIIISFALSYMIMGSYHWYNIYILYIFIIISGAFTLPLIGSRCKRVKLVKC